MFRWNETEVNSNVSTTCFYGPPEVRVTRFCVSRNNLTAPSIENCRTVISDRYININNVRLPTERERERERGGGAEGRQAGREEGTKEGRKKRR